jgi:hypothetical protein
MSAEKRINTMSDLAHYDEDAFSDELPDVALEVAASGWGQAGNPFTFAFCTGLDTCHRPLPGE